MTTGVYSLPYVTSSKMTTATVTRTNETVGYNPTYTATFTISSTLDSTAQAMVYFADGLVFYNSSAGNIICTIKNVGGTTIVKTDCNARTAVDSKSMGSYLTSVVASMECGTLKCVSGSSFVLVISGTGITNAFNTYSANGGLISVSY